MLVSNHKGTSLNFSEFIKKARRSQTPNGDFENNIPLCFLTRKYFQLWELCCFPFHVINMLSSNHKNHNFSEFIKKRQCLRQMVILKITSHFVSWPRNISNYGSYVVFAFTWSICCPPITIRIHALWKDKCGCFISIQTKEKSKLKKFIFFFNWQLSPFLWQRIKLCNPFQWCQAPIANPFSTFKRYL